MTFLKKQSHTAETTFQIAAMVDVVFLLLAFFVMSSSFRTSEKDFKVGYKKSDVPTGAVRTDFPTFISVQLKASGKGTSIIIGRAKLPDNDFRSLTAKLTKINMPEIPVIILAQGQLEIEQVAKAMDAVLASPMKNLSVSKLKIKIAKKPGGVSDGQGKIR